MAEINKCDLRRLRTDLSRIRAANIPPENFASSSLAEHSSLALCFCCVLCALCWTMLQVQPAMQQHCQKLPSPCAVHTMRSSAGQIDSKCTS